MGCDGRVAASSDAGLLLDEQALLALWRKARVLAGSWCGTSLARLRAGHGGFYDDQDFWQDLFIEFWAVVKLWQHGESRTEARLWALWRGALQYGGLRVLKRTPQRLWSGAEQAVEPCVLALDTENVPDASRSPLPPAVRRTLTLDSDEAPGAAEAAELAEALWRLRPLHRQVLYLNGFVGLTADQVAHCLGLTGRDSASQWLHRAREHLRACLSGERSAAWNPSNQPR